MELSMKYNHIGIPTTERFDGEIDLPHLKTTVSDHGNNPFNLYASTTRPIAMLYAAAR